MTIRTRHARAIREGIALGRTMAEAGYIPAEAFFEMDLEVGHASLTARAALRAFRRKVHS